MIPSLIDWMRQHPATVLRTLGEHLQLSGTALALVVAIAMPLAVILSRHPKLAAPVLAIVTTARTVPSLALLVLMLPLLGTGFRPSVAALTVYGLPAVLINTVVGLNGVGRDIVEAARGQGLSERQILLSVRLPLASPAILAGIRTAAVQIVSGATLAVFIGGGGLGELISAGMGLLDTAQLVAGALLVALVALSAEGALGWLERSLRRRFGANP